MGLLPTSARRPVPQTLQPLLKKKLLLRTQSKTPFPGIILDFPCGKESSSPLLHKKFTFTTYFRELVEGKHDDLPEQVCMYVGSIELEVLTPAGNRKKSFSIFLL